MLRLLILTLVLSLAAAADDLSSLNIRIVEGQGQKYALGSRATRGVMVEITDDLGKPVEGHGDLPAAGSRRGRGLFERIEDRSRRKPREWASASLRDAMESHARAVRDAHYGSQGRRSCGDHIAVEPGGCGRNFAS